MKKRARSLAVIFASVMLGSCGGGSSSGVDSSSARVYLGTATIEGSNSCGRSFPGTTSMRLTTNPVGNVIIDYLGEFRWGRDLVHGGLICTSCLSGQTISASDVFDISPVYTNAIQATISGNGTSVSGWHGISGSYGDCIEGYMVRFTL